MKRLSCLVSCCLACCRLAYPAGSPAPGPTPTNPEELPPSFEHVPLILLELSWDFEGVQEPDWRKELVGSDVTEKLVVRWRYTGPDVASAGLPVYDSANGFLGEVDLPLTSQDAGGFRYKYMTIGDFPGAPTITMRARVKDAQGQQVGCASNEAQITEPSPADPFLHTQLFTTGLTTDFGVPGIGGAVSCEQGGSPPYVREFTDGARAFDGGKGAIVSGDRWALGSCTKAVTCTLMGLLIQNGTPLPGGAGNVEWDSPLSDVFPEWSDQVHARFETTTLRHLACHRSGLRMTQAEDAETRVVGGANNDPRQFRRDMTERLLARQHYDTNGVPTAVGTNFFYGSGNYLVLGAVIEQLTGTSYESAMQWQLLQPLGIMSAGFGLPAVNVEYQPHGHYRKPDYPHDMDRDNMVCPPVWNPAGSLFMSLQDWLKFLRLHIDGTEGSIVLNAATLTELHTPHPDLDGSGKSYGFGWGIGWDGGTRLGHNGTYFRFFADCRVYLGYGGFVVAAATNLGPNENEHSSEGPWEDTSCVLAVKALLDHLVEKAKTKQSIGGPPPPGTYAAGSSEGLGIMHLWLPGDPPEWPPIDPWPSPLPQLSHDPGAYAPVSFYLFSEYHRRLAAAARRPRALAFTRDFLDPDRFELVVNTEPGAVYQLWRAPSLLPGARKVLDEEVEAEDTETAFPIDTPAGTLQEFFWVTDLME